MTAPGAPTPSHGGGPIGAGGAVRAGLALAIAALLVGHRALLALDPAAGPRATELDQLLYQPATMEPLFALLAAAVLAVHRRARVAEAVRAGRGTAWGLPLLGLGGALLLWSRQIEADRLLMPSLMLQLVGAALALGGGPLVRALGPSLAALATALVLPPQVLQALVFPLQLWTVSLASALLDLLGRSHAVLGDLVLYGADRFQVIEGCSGFKTIVSLVLAAIVYAAFIVPGPRGMLLLVALAIPIGVFVNGLRVVVLILGRIPPEAPAHAGYGLLAIVVGVVLLAVTETSWTRLRRRGRAGPAASSEAPEPLPGQRVARAARRSRPEWVALGIVAAALAAETVPRASWPSPGPGINVESLPETIDGRTARPLDLDDAWLGDVRFGHRIYRSYEAPTAPGAPPAPADSIRVFVGLEDVSNAERTGYSPKTEIPRSGWRTRARRPPLEVGAAAGEAGRWTRWVIDYPDRVVCVQHRRVGFAPWGLEILGRWLGADRAGWGGVRRAPLVIRLERDVEAGDEDATWMSLRQFAAHVDAWSAGARR